MLQNKQGRARAAAADNLRAVLIAWIIAGHALLGYSALGGWTYAEVTETTFAPAVELTLAALLGSSALFVLGVFFLLAGLFTPGSLERRGAAGFVAGRLRRLGLPLATMVLVIWPLAVWLTYRAAGRPATYWTVLAEQVPQLGAGTLWFVAVLLIFSIGYAAWWRLSGGQQRPRPVTGRRLVAVAIGIAMATFAVRLVFTMGGQEPVDLHVSQWPQLLAMFTIGVTAAGSGLAEAVPRTLYRRCGIALLTVVLSMPLLALVLNIGDVATGVGPFLGGWHWQSLLMAVGEGVLTVAGSMCLLGLAQHKLTAAGPLAAAAGRSSYAAYITQGPVLLALATAAAALPWPAEAKAPLVAALGVLACYLLGWVLVTRTPLGRVV